MDLKGPSGDHLYLYISLLYCQIILVLACRCVCLPLIDNSIMSCPKPKRSLEIIKDCISCFWQTRYQEGHCETRNPYINMGYHISNICFNSGEWDDRIYAKDRLRILKMHSWNKLDVKHGLVHCQQVSRSRWSRQKIF
jgi:hypothetical protein